MKRKRIAALVLFLYAAIFVAVAFHDHFKEPARAHCSICEVSRAPAHAPAITTFAALVLTVQGTCQQVVYTIPRLLLASVTSERAPPTL